MKKRSIFIGIFIALTIQSAIAFANAQGACSWHGGVNCAAGPDWDGSEVCNDGWRDSTVNYWTTIECKQYLCTGQRVLREALIKKAEEKGGTLDPERTRSQLFEDLELYGPESLMQDAQQRMVEIELVYDEINEIVDSMRFTCWDNSPTTTNEKITCVDTTNGYLGSDDKCYCNTGFTWSDSENKCITFNVCPFENSYLSNNLCYCNQGFQWNENQTECIQLAEKTCINGYLNANGQCDCNSGYKWNYAKNECVMLDKECPFDHSYYFNNICHCTAGYELSEDNTACIAKTKKQNTTSSEKTTTQGLTDINDSPNKKAILYLYNEGIINGYEDKTFRPNNTINRAELIKILVEGKFSTPPNDIYKNCFTDVKTEWYASYICFAKSKKWIDGYPDGTFKPEETVIKAEAIKMLLNSQDVDIPTTDSIPGMPYNDVHATTWYGPYIYKAKQLGLLEETFVYAPGQEMTRGKISENLYRLIRQ